MIGIRHITTQFNSLRTGIIAVHNQMEWFTTQSLGKSVTFGSNLPKPSVLPDPEPSQAPPSPQPLQYPIIEIPGPINEPALPQSQPDSKPPIEIPAPNRNVDINKTIGRSVEDDVIIKDVGDRSLITLNRPKALNALNLSMVCKIHPVLKKWESTKELIIIEGAGNKAFCAGGDVKSIAIDLTKPNGNTTGEEFFRNEYKLNYLIGTYKKPYIALINGITMGGGVGLSVHGKYRVATENTLFAMPETAIGLFPDVGGTYFLPRLKRKLGVFLGLTGYRLKGVDVFLAGIATHFVPSDKLLHLKKTLLTQDVNYVEEILTEYQPKQLNHEFSLAPYMDKIENCFSADTVEQIIDRLNKDGSEWALKTVQTLLKMSPTALKVTKKAIDEGSNLDLARCLKMEYRLACSTLYKESDFYEGVRALLIDKDQNPKWNPQILSDVTNEYVNQRFKMLPSEKELQLEDE